MSKINLNDELLELERIHSKKKNAGNGGAYPTKQPSKPADTGTKPSAHKDLLDELANAANQAGTQNRERKQEAKQEKEKAQKVKDTTRLAAVCAVVIIAVAILFFFVFDGGNKKHNTKAEALTSAAELGSANEWQRQAGPSAAGNNLAVPPQQPQQQNGFQNNPM